MVAVTEEIVYTVVDYHGYVQWVLRDDGRYFVDPLFLDKFKIDKGIK